jgi:hypothetical protein
MIIWRIGAAHSDTPATRFRAIFPAFCMWRIAEVNSTFTCGSPNRRILAFGEIGQTNALILSSAVSNGDIDLARMAASAGWRVILDQVDNPYEHPTSNSEQRGFLRRSLLPAVHAITFSNRSIRNECVANGFPAEKCYIAPVPDLSQTDAKRAVEWAHFRVLKFSPFAILPIRKGWQSGSRGEIGNASFAENDHVGKNETSGERDCAVAWFDALQIASTAAMAL